MRSFGHQMNSTKTNPMNTLSRSPTTKKTSTQNSMNGSKRSQGITSNNDTTPRRLIVKGKNPVCTHGYAITQRAARKLLLELNEWLPFPVDITVIHYIDEGRFKAYSVIPPLLVQWRDTGDPMKNSDIEKEGIEETRNWGILRSARKNVIDWYSLT